MRDDPTAIRLDVKANRLAITWADGHECTYAGGYLRMICPCAMCRGHAPGEVEPPTWEASRDVRATGVALVGAYALRIDLSDGHGSGIYSFSWLRTNCPEERPDGDEAGRPPEG